MIVTKRTVIFILRRRYENDDFLTVIYAHAILRLADTRRSGSEEGVKSDPRTCTRRRPRLGQVPSVLISQISGREIANTKT